MKNSYIKGKAWLLKTSLFAFIALSIAIYGCHKEANSTNGISQKESINPKVSAAKSWYQINFSKRIDKPAQATNSVGGEFDLSQFFSPEWNDAINYTRIDDDVIEMPIDSGSKLALAVGSNTAAKSNSRSSVLILRKSESYRGFLMTIVGDADYINGNPSKLYNNSYNKRDEDFSGMVYYTTLKGKFVSGYTYKQGVIKGELVSNVTPSGNQIIQSIKPNLVQYEVCTNWYQQVYDEGIYTWIYLDQLSCHTVIEGDLPGGIPPTSGGSSGSSGGGGGSGGSTTPNQPEHPCDIKNVESVKEGKTVNTVNVQKLPGDGGGFPPVPDDPCPTSPEPVRFIIDVSKLKSNFPCAVKLILDKLSQNGVYTDFVQPFTTAQRPNLSWTNNNLAWNSTSPINNQPNSYELANTATDPASGIGQSSIITLNTKMLQNSSQLIIASAAIHETLHAYINYNIATAEDNVRNHYNDYGSWFAGLDAFYTVRSLPSNYRDHYQMLTDYYDKSVAMLSAWDNNAHSLNDYRMASLYGLNTVDANCPAALKATLDKVYNDLLTKFGFTASALSTFNSNQLNASASQKLPTSGCN